MFRHISKLKGLIIDFDSFPLDYFDDCDFSTIPFRILFISCKNVKEFKNCKCLQLPGLFLGLNQEIQRIVLNYIDLKQTEIAYVSANYEFIKTASYFYSGTILVSHGRRFSYKEFSPVVPDFVFSSFEETINWFSDSHSGGYVGEECVTSYNATTFRIISVDLYVDSRKVFVFSFGRYFGTSTYMDKLHPYSSAIFLNKNKPSNKSYGKQNDYFKNLFVNVGRSVLKDFSLNCVVSVPVKEGQKSRFDDITKYIASNLSLEDCSYMMTSSQNSNQKQLDFSERRTNVQDKFHCNGRFDDKSVLLIDDVMTTGNTISECCKVLFSNGAKDIYVMVLAFNQIATPYWSPNVPRPLDSKGELMWLNYQEKNPRKFFYVVNSSSPVQFFDYKKIFDIITIQIDGEFT